MTTTFADDNGTSSSSTEGTSFVDNNQHNDVNSDIQEILKRDKHAQEHIKTLEAENREFREKLQALESKVQEQTTIEQMLERMQQGTTSSDLTGQVDVDKLVPEVEKRVLSQLSASQKASQEQENWETVISQLKQKHGDSFSSYVDKRAQELNLSVVEMQRLAKQSPNAFMELVDKSTPRSGQPTQSSHSTSQFNSQGLKTKDDFEREAAAKPELMKDKAFQEEMRKAILRDKFGVNI